MFTKNYAKVIQSLQSKKFRQKYNLFVVEGIKSVKELTNTNYQIENLFFTAGNWDKTWPNASQITPAQLKQISSFANPNQVLAVCKMPEPKKFVKSPQLSLVLDDVRDPGNLGTIIRLADWFGVEQIICSSNSVDVYNPKCIQASMGSFAAVDVFYDDLPSLLQNSEAPIFGTFMEGENIYQNKLPNHAFLVLGNEANGISEELKELCNTKLSIPHFGKQHKTESLNVAMATSIFLSEYRRVNP